MPNQPENTISHTAPSGFRNLLTHLNRNKLKIVVGLVVLACVFTTPILLPTNEQRSRFIMDSGYWILLVVFTCFLLFVTRLAIRENSLINWIHAHKWAMVVALGLTGFLWANDWHGFKVLFDEHLMGEIAVNMHLHQKAGIYDTLHILHGTTIGLDACADKRPLFFQFLTSLTHRLTGLRPENAIYLNISLTFLFLTFIYSAVTRLTNRFYGFLSMGLMAGLPLLAENATGGGFDITNLLFISILLLLAMRFVEKPDALGLNATVATAVILANTRYESVIYVLVPCLLLIWLWLRNDQLKLTWFAVLSPFFLILPLVINRISLSEGGLLDMEMDQLFSFRHIGHNLTHACVFLFTPTKMGTNSLLLSFLGLISTISLFVLAGTRFQNRSMLPSIFVPMIVVAGCILSTVFIAMLWGWGEWTDPLASRFSLPLHALWAVTVPVVFYYLLHYRTPPVLLTVLTLVFLFGINYPIGGLNRGTQKFLPAKECAWAIDYIKRNNLNENSFFISFASYGLHMYQLPAIPTEIANISPSMVYRTTELGIYKQVYVIQEIRAKHINNPVRDVWPEPLSPDYVLETVAEKQFDINLSIRISRIVGVKNEEVEPLMELPMTPADYRRFLLSQLPRDMGMSRLAR